MDKEQKKRMASRTVVQCDEGQGDIEYTVQVSGSRVELHQQYEQPYENEHGTGPDISVETWVMSKAVLKEFLKAAAWCIEQSEAYEAAHPQERRDDARTDAAYRL